MDEFKKIYKWIRNVALIIILIATVFLIIWIVSFWVSAEINGKNILPIVVIPTTAGTGAEVTNMSVIKHSAEKFKSALADWALNPRVSIVDPELTLTVPSHVTAPTGFDAFCHAFECLINRNASDFIDLYALDSIIKIFKYLPIAIEDGTNRELLRKVIGDKDKL
jgi:alcohol dehydrogenase class IV